MRVSMKSLAKAAICRSRAARVSRRFLKCDKALILRYHSVSSREEKNHLYVLPRVAVGPAIFDQQVSFLARHYNVVSMDTIAEHIRERKPFESRTVAITFDDGYADNYRHAFPSLTKHGVTATFYVATGPLSDDRALWTSRVRYHLFSTELQEIELESLGRRYRLDCESEIETAFAEIAFAAKSTDCSGRDDIVEELVRKSGVDEGQALKSAFMRVEHLREMSVAGMSIGGHTVTHPNLPAAGAEDARAEIAACTEHLREALGEPPRHFSYPNGRVEAHYDEHAIAGVRDCGYLTATTSKQGTARHTDDPYTLRRIYVGNAIKTTGEFELLLERARLFSGH
jgi:peptidoglycan/xylan/chitin deacetylase (PgdA/CDA1 family)